jgi:hypothetical protein
MSKCQLTHIPSRLYVQGHPAQAPQKSNFLQNRIVRESLRIVFVFGSDVCHFDPQSPAL